MPPQKLPKGQNAENPARDPAPDPRFDALQTDPRYRPPSAKRTRIKLDRRLGGILRDDAFARKAKVDRYGRKVGAGQGRKELERLYQLASDDEDENEGKEDDEKVRRELRRASGEYDPAREGGFSTSEDSDDDSEDGSEEDIADEDAAEGALPDPAAEVPTGDATSRLAVVNLDWDNIRAQDIMAVAASFAPEGGRVLGVAVYPSEFGRERMEREEMEGPPREIFQPCGKGKRLPDRPSVAPAADLPDVDSDYEGSEDEEIKKQLLQEDEGVDFDSTALRQYQLERLRYFYAVIQCSSVGVARALYDSMDGHEYLSSANFFDMRFIPDDVDFDIDRPRESCTEIEAGYKPTEFTTDALMHSNVKLTWDADDTKRKDVQKRAFSRKEIDENDLLAYIGSGSSSDDDDGEEFEGWDDENADVRSTVSRTTTQQSRRENLRAALGLDLEPPPGDKKRNKEEKHVGDMQITFTPALSGKQGDVFMNDQTAAETTQQRYIRKERERKAARKERAKDRRAAELPAGDAEGSENGKAADEPGQGDDAWNDPFFDDPSRAISESRKQRRDRNKKAANEKSTAEQDDSNKAELELVMMDDGDATKGGRHFDIKAIERAEKGAKKLAKAKKSKGGKKAAESEVKDDFDVNIKDPRFNQLFEDPTFAIDPSSHKFRDTKGMRAILSEKRKRGHDPSHKTEGGPGKTADANRIKDRDLMDLVAKVKKVKR